MESVKELVNQISSNLSQRSSSQKDEVRVMRAMLNDKDYVVNVYGKEGIEGTTCPSAEARELVSSVLNTGAKISQSEAASIADNYEFKKSEAQSMINISKEFVNTYLETGRKLPLGGRETSDVSLMKKDVKETVRKHPKKVGVNEDGSARIENTTTVVKAHSSVAVKGSCPSWIKNSK